MNCFLHIGTEKTGSTTIQSFFYDNQKKLTEQNFYYPLSLRLPNNRFLSLAAYDPSRRDDLTRILNIHSDTDLLKFQKKIVNEFYKEIRSVPSGSTIITSGEHIQSRLTTNQEIQRLKEILYNAGIDDITIIVYLRNPAEIANSYFSTAIKSGETFETVPEPSHAYLENLCNHKATVEKYSSVFGKENVVVRLFRKDKFAHKSLINDISEVIGINLDDKALVFAKRKNESLSLLGIKILTELNKKIPRFVTEGENPARIGLAVWIAKHFSEPRFVMEKELYHAYDSYYENSNQWIKENYFPEEPELFPFKHPESVPLKISDTELQQITGFISELWLSRSDVLNNEWYNFRYKSKKQKVKTLVDYLLNIARLK